MLIVSHGHWRGEYYMSEAQYNTLILALKNPRDKAEGCFLNASIK